MADDEFKEKIALAAHEEWRQWVGSLNPEIRAVLANTAVTDFAMDNWFNLPDQAKEVFLRMAERADWLGRAAAVLQHGRFLDLVRELARMAATAGDHAKSLHDNRQQSLVSALEVRLGEIHKALLEERTPEPTAGDELSRLRKQLADAERELNEYRYPEGDKKPPPPVAGSALKEEPPAPATGVPWHPGDQHAQALQGVILEFMPQFFYYRQVADTVRRTTSYPAADWPEARPEVRRQFLDQTREFLASSPGFNGTLFQTERDLFSRSALRLVRRLEWHLKRPLDATGESHPCCPACLALSPGPHEFDCPVAVVLAHADRMAAALGGIVEDRPTP